MKHLHLHKCASGIYLRKNRNKVLELAFFRPGKLIKEASGPACYISTAHAPNHQRLLLPACRIVEK